uniref:helix-turn-helix domain-containing protein n=1 Tax=Agathobacter sp. TaxID=2021311 RepID=UPI0040567999
MKNIEEDTPGQRIADLCKDYGISQKELAKKIGLSAPQLSRIISGKTPTINSDALIGIAETFKVSTDYILGLSSVSVRKSYDISQLSLSENAIKGLVTETIDVEILNRLLENPKFPQLLNLIRIYFEDSVALGIMSRNDMTNMATMSLTEYMQQNQTQKAEAKHNIHLLNAQKFGEHEAEIERMKNIFMSICEKSRAILIHSKSQVPI